MGKSKPIRVGDDLQEDVHGVQYACQVAVFAIFTDNLQEKTEWVPGEGRALLQGGAGHLHSQWLQAEGTSGHEMHPLHRTKGLAFKQLKGRG